MNDLEDALRRDAELWRDEGSRIAKLSARCGQNIAVSDKEAGGCGGHLQPQDIYRCADCDTPFHKQCIRRHFEQDGEVTAVLRLEKSVLIDGVNALLGLIQLISGRSDLTPDLREVLKDNHRVKEAEACLASITPDPIGKEFKAP